ncbi:MAG TPA: hypothetical protein PLN52_14960 [Opitutaceae bacterium]|nr:hypothetical protein [Opitutaceae bacterium]
MKLNHDLVRERLTYPFQPVPSMAVGSGEYEWSFRDRFGNRCGRLFWRRAVTGGSAEGEDWVGVFGREIHCSEYVVGNDFAVVTVAEGTEFSLFLVRPMGVPTLFYSSPWLLKIEGLNPDETLLLVQSAVEGDCFRPALVVMDLKGVELARLTGVREVRGVWHAHWSPNGAARCVVFSHEADGFLRPALWFPFENTIEEIAVPWEGEVTAEWSRSGEEQPGGGQTEPFTFCSWCRGF